MKENIFYVVLNDDFPTSVSYKHESFESADREAQRLARIASGQKFTVMKSIVAYQKNEFIKSEFVESWEKEDVPF